MAISEIINFIRGSRDYAVPCECADKAAGLLMMSGADYRRMRRVGDSLTFRLFDGDAKTAERILAKHGISFTVTKRRGLSYLVYRYRKRPGIIVGGMLFLLIVFLSGRFIWTMDVIGNDRISESEIITRLESLGCGVGTPMSSIDFNSLQNRFLLKYNDVSWISVNMKGTSANVEVLEMQSPEKAPDMDAPYNLVASETGVIEYVEILRGKPVVTEGVIVREGELLASGVEDMKHGYRVVHAMGTVMAQVRRDVTVEVPLESTELVPTGKVYSEKSLRLFGFSARYFSNTEDMSADDDTEYKRMSESRQVSFFDTVRVPIWVSRVSFEEYRRVPVTYTEAEAKEIAFARLREECEKAVSGAELVSRETEVGIIDGVYTVRCRLVIVKNIAKESPIYRGDGTAENNKE